MRFKSLYFNQGTAQLVLAQTKSDTRHYFPLHVVPPHRIRRLKIFIKFKRADEMLVKNNHAKS